MTSHRARARMVRIQLEKRGILDQKVLAVMQTIPRHEFVDEALAERAYGAATLPIGQGQTLSQPYTVACMTEALELTGNEEVLEIGTGSGYQTAVLSRLCRKVYTIEFLKSLAASARRRLRRLGYHNIIYREGDGSLGWPEERSFDHILVTAGAPVTPQKLLRQLKPDGFLVLPEGDRKSQKLVRISWNQEGESHREVLGDCCFVPLVGEDGWGTPG